MIAPTPTLRPSHNRAVALAALVAAAVVTLQWRHVGRVWASHISKLAKATLAPPLELTDAAGRTIFPSELEGRSLVVTFWAAWCAPCRRELPELAAVVEQWNDQASSTDRAVLLAINGSDEVDSLSMFLGDPQLRSVRFAFDRTGATGERWNVVALPTTVLVDKNGRIRHIQEGYDRQMAGRLARCLRGEDESEHQP